MVGRIVRWVALPALGAVWWWAVLRIALGHGAGIVEGAVVAGGWGLSLLPVHCVPEGQATGLLPAGRWVAAWRAGGTTRASPHPRSGEVSDRS
ncbi:hypothetical protein AB0C13_21825 [Streptomyces sp. NPDC049099]|uniref:hypothetical protein n=1 Tax=Streptomyces sp. NPDC049099 TaxID=3155768 RepID=UPI00344593A5